MTEAEWLDCTDPKKMLEFVGAKASERRIRLFAVACCRAMWGLMDEWLQSVVEVGERYADVLIAGRKPTKIAASRKASQGCLVRRMCNLIRVDSWE
jgi:hypothetical protein